MAFFPEPLCFGLTAHSPLQRYLDSIAMLDFVVFIENKFAIAIDDSEVTPKNFSTLANVAAYINSKTSV